MKVPGISGIKTKDKRKYFKNNREGEKVEEDISDLEYIRHQIHHLGDNPYTLGLIPGELENSDGKNYYTEKELSAAIKKMSEKLGE